MEMAQKDKLIYAEESFIADVQFALHNLLLAKNVSRSELAKLLSISDSRVSQIFSDNPKNLTLRTIARVFAVVEDTAHLTSETLSKLIPVPGSAYNVESLAVSQDDGKGMCDKSEIMVLEYMKGLNSAYDSEANDNQSECERVAA